MSDRQVWVLKPHGRAPACYHTDAECRVIKRPEKLRDDWTEETLPWDVPECEWCSGGVDTGASNSGHVAALKEKAGGESA